MFLTLDEVVGLSRIRERLQAGMPCRCPDIEDSFDPPMDQTCEPCRARSTDACRLLRESFSD